MNLSFYILKRNIFVRWIELSAACGQPRSTNKSVGLSFTKAFYCRYYFRKKTETELVVISDHHLMTKQTVSCELISCCLRNSLFYWSRPGRHVCFYGPPYWLERPATCDLLGVGRLLRSPILAHIFTCPSK